MKGGFEFYRNLACTYLFKPWKVNGVHERYGFIAVLKMLYPEVVRSIRSRTCPFCGRRFKRFSDIKQHLTYAHGFHRRTLCYYEFLDMLQHVAAVFMEAKNTIIPNFSHGPRAKYRLRDRQGVQHCFKTIAEAVKFYIKEYMSKKGD